MRKLRRATLAVDLMESRALLSGTAHAMSTTSDASEVQNIARQPVSVAADAKFMPPDSAVQGRPGHDQDRRGPSSSPTSRT